MAGGDIGTSLPSPARGGPLDFNSVVTLGTELLLCCILGHCRFLSRGSLIIRISFYRYKTKKGQTPNSEVSRHAGVCAGVPAPSPSTPAPGLGDVVAATPATHSVVGGLSQAWGDTRSPR